ncbi:UNVERIFIED_CONTAM: Pentatricopeptide repeat-containing protein [Sesamum angustifolium]|uniref:Pentatricopeptide repeat-containing protein n=1 Tax=Sesamum angustifolium TaxID=2727405 RepID=A0AAW2M7Z0_9LAMI
MLSSEGSSRSCSDVVDACIYLGWLETAHDILDDLESEKYCVRETSYTSLLAAYYNKKMLREAEGLVRQIRRVNLAISFPDDMAFSSLVSKSEDERSDLANSIIQNMREEDKAVSFLVHEYNSSIYFFTKAKMIEDATQTYRKMQKMKIQPNAATFFHLICGYCSSGMYREITILWGDIKRSMENQNTIYNRDLYELLLLNFVRGGYFERVMEVIGFMMENNMFLDKWSYKTEFLKFHRDLYRTLTALEGKDEAQKRRIEHVHAFRKFVGIV